MNREILFRGFHKEENGKETIYIDGQIVKGKWVEGYYSKTDLGMFINQYRVDYEDECTYCEDFEVIPETICQYTGLNDRVGDKIFENDILREYSNEIEDWKVSYEYGKFVGTCDNVCEDLWEIHDMEVIGNIFDEEVK